MVMETEIKSLHCYILFPSIIWEEIKAYWYSFCYPSIKKTFHVGWSIQYLLDSILFWTICYRVVGCNSVSNSTFHKFHFRKYNIFFLCNEENPISKNIWGLLLYLKLKTIIIFIYIYKREWSLFSWKILQFKWVLSPERLNSISQDFGESICNLINYWNI